MPIARFEMPDGRIGRFEVPEGTTPEDAQRLIEEQVQSAGKNVTTQDRVKMLLPFGEKVVPMLEQAGPAAKDVAMAPVRAMLAVGKLPANVARLAGYGKPAQMIEQADLAAKEYSAPQEGFMGTRGPISTAASLGGDIVSGGALLKGLQLAAAPLKTVPMFQPAAQFISKSPTTQATIGGGTLGAMGAEEADPLSLLKSTGLGAGFGAAGQTIATGLGKVMNPALERLKQLRAAGIDTTKLEKEGTMGQVLGGRTQQAENLLSLLPFGGVTSKIQQGAKAFDEAAALRQAGIKTSQKTAEQGLTEGGERAISTQKAALQSQMANLDDRFQNFVQKTTQNLDQKQGQFSTPIINRALANINQKLPDNVSGTRGIEEAQKLISNAYDDVLTKIGEVKITPQAAKSLDDLKTAYKRKLGGENSENYNRFAAYIDELLESGGESRLLDAKQWQVKLQDLGTDSYNYSSSSNAAQREYGQALKELKNKWMQLIEDSTGSAEIKAINKAHSEFQAPQRAASYVASITKGGEFDPKQLLNAIKAGTSTKRFAAGTDDLQKQTTKAFQEMAKERAALKAQHEDFAKQLKQKKSQMGQEFAGKKQQTKRNVASQKELTKLEADLEKQAVKDIGEEVKEGANATYAQNRLAYGLTGLGGAGYGASKLFGLSPELSALAAGTGIIGTRALYSQPMQSLIKKAAVAPRSEAVQQLGTSLQQAAPAIGVGAAAARENVPEPQGNLPGFKEGGSTTPAWQRKEGKNPEGGLNALGRASYNRETGGKLKAPQPEGGSRKKSFCARMGGMKKKLTSSKTANDPDSRINKALRKWKCQVTSYNAYRAILPHLAESHQPKMVVWS